MSGRGVAGDATTAPVASVDKRVGRGRGIDRDRAAAAAVEAARRGGQGRGARRAIPPASAFSGSGRLERQMHQEGHRAPFGHSEPKRASGAFSGSGRLETRAPAVRPRARAAATAVVAARRIGRGRGARRAIFMAGNAVESSPARARAAATAVVATRRISQSLPVADAGRRGGAVATPDGTHTFQFQSTASGVFVSIEARL